MRGTVFRVALAALALAATGAQAQPRPAPSAWPLQARDLPADPAVRFGTLPNGMRYALRRGQTPPGQASIRLRIGLGSINEAEDQRGLAHFLEHMVLNGTTNVPEGEFAARLERHGLRLGADTNAMTDWTQTVFKLDLPRADAASIDTALFLLREIAGDASLTQSAIDAERGVIQAEERARAGPALNIAQDEMLYLLPGQLAARRIPGGTPEVIAGAPRERFTALYDAYYRPERATLIAVGDFDLDDMERRLRERFAGWRGRGPAGTDPDLGRPAARRMEARIYVEPAAPARISFAWVRPARSREDSVEARTAEFVDQLVLQILNRRLERIAATQSPSPFLVGFGARTQVLGSGDVTLLSAIVQPGQWQQGLRAIETERHRLAEDGVTQAELDREVQHMANTLAGETAGESTRPSAEAADALVASADMDKVHAEPLVNEMIVERLRGRLTVRQLNRAARAMFAGEPILYMTSPTPVAEGEAGMLAAWREANGARLATVAAHTARAWPYTEFGAPGTVAERRELPAAIGATAVRFANGVLLTVKRTEFSDDHILISVRAGRGRLDLPAERSLAAWAYPAAMVGGGFGRISFDDMQETLSGRAFMYNASVEDDAFVFTGSARSGDVPLQLQILAAQVSDPGWQASGWDRIRGLSGSAYDTFESTPMGVVARDGAALLHGGDRRWATPTREEMAATSIADLRALLERPLTQGPIEVIIVGDITVDEAIRETAATFGALPRRPDPSATPPAAGIGAFPALTAQPVRVTHNGRADQGLAMIAWPTAGFYADVPRARALDLLSDLFTTRLIEEVRERQGTGYSPRVWHEASRVLPGYGLIMGAIDARPEALPDFLRETERIAADLRDRPVGADELRRALLPRVEAVQRERNGNEWWLTNLAGIQQDPRVARAILSELDDYRAITPDVVQRVAREVLQPGRTWSVFVVPRQGAGAPAAGAAAPAGGH